jgi:ribosomal-protein-alanine N-acetyltransferase
MSRSGPAERLAAIHAASFPMPWDAGALAALLDQEGVFAIEEEDGFVLLRAIVDEAEILTLAVRPTARRQGLGTRLVDRGRIAAGARGATRLFLEVAEDNTAALALYARAGFLPAGRRAGYYARPGGGRTDALILALNLPATLP